MKWTFYIAALAAALVVPVERSDVGKLQPIEVITLYMEDGNVAVGTDTGDRGEGMTVEMALEDLKHTTPGIVYLDTAEYLLTGENAVELIPEIGKFLKEDVKLCAAQQGIEPAQAAPYLDVHSPEMTLGTWKEGGELEHLTAEKEILRLMKKDSGKS